MANRLLDRQARLLEYLSSAEAIFGDTNATVDQALREIDRDALHLQARFACNKRIDKIMRVLPRTFDLLGADRRLILREFVELSRPTNKSSLVNAGEFHEFLVARWQCEPPKPAYLPDVTACEMAMAEVRRVADGRDEPEKRKKSLRSKRRMRRHRTVVPLLCTYDVRSILDADRKEIAPAKRDTPLVVVLPAGFSDFRILEVARIVVDALKMLDDWADPSTLNAIGCGEDLISYLLAQEFIEAQA